MSILDYKQEELSQDIWDSSYTIKESVKLFIIQALENFFTSIDIINYGDFVLDGFIGSSLATYFYTDDSDLDIKIVIDINEFKKTNPRFYDMSDDDILEYLVDTGRKSYFLTTNIPGTSHPLDIYFYSDAEFRPIHFNRYDSLYSIAQDVWIKEPMDLSVLNNTDTVLEIAKQKAMPYIESLTLDIAKAKRDTIDLIIFKDYIKKLDKDDLRNVYDEYKKLYKELEDSLNELVEQKEDIKSLRRDEFTKDGLETELEKILGSNNYSDGNLIYKVLQRYGYMKILVEISELFNERGIDLDTLEEYHTILR